MDDYLYHLAVEYVVEMECENYQNEEKTREDTICNFFVSIMHLKHSVPF